MEDVPPPQQTPVEDSHVSETGQLKRALAEFIAARIELASIEAKEATTFAIRKTIYALVLGMCAVFAWILILAGLTALLSNWAHEQLGSYLPGIPGWGIVVFILAGIHVLIAIVLLILLKRKSPSPLFELTRKEIENDKAWAKKQDIAKRKQELISTLAENRVLITEGKAQLKEKLNVKRQMGRVFKRRPKTLFIGSLTTGLLMTLLFKRKKQPTATKPATKGTVLLGWLLSLLKPAIKAWLINRAKAIAVEKMISRRQKQHAHHQTPTH